MVRAAAAKAGPRGIIIPVSSRRALHIPARIMVGLCAAMCRAAIGCEAVDTWVSSFVAGQEFGGRDRLAVLAPVRPPSRLPSRLPSRPPSRPLVSPLVGSHAKLQQNYCRAIKNILELMLTLNSFILNS